MGDGNPIRTLGDYSKPSHEGYRNTIELPVGEQYGTSLIRHHPVGAKRILIPQTSVRGSKPTPQGFPKSTSNWLERLSAGSITTWEDLTTRFLAQFFSPRRTAKLRNDILMFQQHQRESLSEAWTQDLSLYDNESWNDPRDFAKPGKAIALPQDVPSTSDCRLIELENQVQRLMEAHLAPTQPTQVNKITTSFPPSSNTKLIRTKEEDGDVMFIEIIPMDDNFRKEEPEAKGQEVEYFDIFPTRSEPAYH
ncbi:MAK10-like protein, partial [Tanacetum coccineum]